MCATPVFAEDKPSKTGSETEKTVNAEVNYKVDSRYAWSIPAKIDFGANAGEGKTLTVNADKGAEVQNTLPSADNNYTGSAPMVCVTENIIAPEHALKISIDTLYSTYDAGSGFYVGNQGRKTIEKLYFKVAKPAVGKSPEEELTASKRDVLSVFSGTKTGKQALVFTLKTTTGQAEMAGEYTGTIVFKSAVEPTT